jgi:sialate O-acetylesterase
MPHGTWAHSQRALLAVLVTAAATAVGEVRLPHVFSDHMVLQREMPIRVWGWAAADEAVTVRLGDAEAKTTGAADSRWSVELPPMKAGGPLALSVAGAASTLTLDDVLIGEVWLCSGQSNMEWGLKNTANGKEAAAEANHPRIRLAHVPWKTAAEPQDDVDFKWKLCTTEGMNTGGFFNAGFSAIAYYFARELERELDVPVGVIQTTWSGTRIEGWIPRAGYAASPDVFAEQLKQIEAATPAFDVATRNAVSAIEAWLPGAKAAVVAGKPVPAPPEWPKHALDNNHEPTGIFNAQVAPLIPFTIRGVLWYQGESNRGDGMAYHDKMKALIGGWRQLWKLGDFPFYFVQLAPFTYNDDRGPLALAELWEAQVMTLSVPNTGLAGTSDIGDLRDIHPKNKLDVAKRLARWALAKTYGRDGIVVSGPIYRAHTLEGSAIRIAFDHAASGLVTRDGKPPNWFQIAGADGKFVEAQTEIVGDAVLVRGPGVTNPAAVRFAWDQSAEPNLMNTEGLPALPFRIPR